MPITSGPSRLRFAYISIIAFALLISSTSVRAQGTRELEEAEWFGWQNLATDGAALALGVTGLALDAADVDVAGADGWLFGLGLVTFALGSPIVDFAHGNGRLALGSLALRLSAGLATLVGVIDNVLACENAREIGEPCSAGYGWLALGGVLAAAAVVLDGVLDREPASRRDASLPIGLALREDGALLMLQGAL